MKLTVTGLDNRYYAETLCMLLFPGAKFAESETAEDGAPYAEVTVRKTADGTAARVTVGCEGRAESAEVTEQGTDPEKAAKRAVGKAFLAAGEKLLSYRPAFGMLVGVRPAKLAMQALLCGMTHEEICAHLSEEYLLSPEKAELCAAVAECEHAVDLETPQDGCSVYLSIPFCPTRCAYCSFISYATKGLLDLIPSYLDQLCRDTEKTFALIRSLGLRPQTVYIGGGTPTTLNERQLDRLLSCIGSAVDPASLREFTLEAGRPDTVSAEKFRIAREHGVTRVSVNPQTLNDEILEKIGRRHTAAEFFRAFEAARNAGIPVINTDLIAGLPGESFESFSASVDGVIALAPENLTVHTFSVKKSADLRRQGVYSREGEIAMQSVAYSHARAREAGYAPYYLYRQKNTVGNLENVGFARDGKVGYYNIYMMEEQHSVFACGAGAVTRLVSPDRRFIERIFSPKYPYEYLRKDSKNTVSEESCEKIRNFYLEHPISHQ